MLSACWLFKYCNRDSEPILKRKFPKLTFLASRVVQAQRRCVCVVRMWEKESKISSRKLTFGTTSSSSYAGETAQISSPYSLCKKVFCIVLTSYMLFCEWSKVNRESKISSRNDTFGACYVGNMYKCLLKCNMYSREVPPKLESECGKAIEGIVS